MRIVKSVQRSECLRNTRSVPRHLLFEIPNDPHRVEIAQPEFFMSFSQLCFRRLRRQPHFQGFFRLWIFSPELRQLSFTVMRITSGIEPFLIHRCISVHANEHANSRVESQAFCLNSSASLDVGFDGRPVVADTNHSQLLRNGCEIVASPHHRSLAQHRFGRFQKAKLALHPIFFANENTNQDLLPLNLDLSLDSSPGNRGSNESGPRSENVAGKTEPVGEFYLFFDRQQWNADREKQRQNGGQNRQADNPQSLIPPPHWCSLASLGFVVERIASKTKFSIFQEILRTTTALATAGPTGVGASSTALREEG